MACKKWEVWLADLNPQVGTEPGKILPVVIIQTDLLNECHPSAIICPVTTKIEPQAEILRVHLKSGEAGLQKSSDILADQIRAIDKRRLISRLGIISDRRKMKLVENISIILDLKI